MKENNPKKTYPVDMNKQINLDSVSFVSVTIDKNKIYKPKPTAKKKRKNKNKTDKPYNPNEAALISAQNSLFSAWGKDTKTGKLNLKKALEIVNNLKKKFKNEYNINKAISDAINLVIEEDVIQDHNLLKSEMKKNLSIRKALYSALVDYNAIKDAIEPKSLLIDSSNNYAILEQVDDQIERLLNHINIENLEILIQDFNNVKIPSGKKGRRLGIFNFALPHLIQIWQEGAMNPKLQCSRSNELDGGYKGAFFDFIVSFNSILEVKDINLSLGTPSSLGRTIEQYLKNNRK